MHEILEPSRLVGWAKVWPKKKISLAMDQWLRKGYSDRWWRHLTRHKWASWNGPLQPKKKSFDLRVPTARRMNRIELRQRKRLWNWIEQCMNRLEPHKLNKCQKFGENSCFLPNRDTKSKNRPQIWNQDEKLSQKHLVNFWNPSQSQRSTL